MNIDIEKLCEKNYKDFKKTLKEFLKGNGEKYSRFDHKFYDFWEEMYFIHKKEISLPSSFCPCLNQINKQRFKELNGSSLLVIIKKWLNCCPNTAKKIINKSKLMGFIR